MAMEADLGKGLIWLQYRAPRETRASVAHCRLIEGKLAPAYVCSQFDLLAMTCPEHGSDLAQSSSRRHDLYSRVLLYDSASFHQPHL
jgi:hypothetical protein